MQRRVFTVQAAYVSTDATICYSGRVQWYHDPVLNEKIRRERERLGIQRTRLARDAGVPRSQLIIFEDGGNVTLSTLEKILAQLPTLRLDVLPANLDIDAAVKAATDVQKLVRHVDTAMSHLIAMLGGTPIEQPRGGGAERYEAALEISPELGDKLERMIDEIEEKKKRQRGEKQGSARRHSS